MTPTLPLVFPDVPKAGESKPPPPPKGVWVQHWLVDVAVAALLVFLLFSLGFWSWVSGK